MSTETLRDIMQIMSNQFITRQSATPQELFKVFLNLRFSKFEIEFDAERMQFD